MTALFLVFGVRFRNIIFPLVCCYISISLFWQLDKVNLRASEAIIYEIVFSTHDFAWLMKNIWLIKIEIIY